MRKYVFIGMGGTLGALLRFFAREILPDNYQGNFPYATLFVNVSGSFLLALIISAAVGIWKFDADARLGVTVGLLGAYTTFSTFCKETVDLMNGGFYFKGVAYGMASIVLGLAAIYAGWILIQRISMRRCNDNDGVK